MPILLVLILPSFNAEAQRIEGTYFGKILSNRNALQIKESKKNVTGSVYISENYKIDFIGTYTNHLLKMSLTLQDGSQVSFNGKIEKDYLILYSVSGKVENNAISLYKVSGKANIAIGDLFSEKHDPQLLGKWETIKSFNKYGVLRKAENMLNYEFYFNGIGYLQMTNFKEDVFKGIENLLRQEIKWTTQGNELNILFKFNNQEINSNYMIKSDTLIIKDEGGAVTLYKREGSR